MVVFEQTAQTLRADNLAIGVLRSQLYHPPTKPSVGTLVVVVLKIFADNISQLLLARQDEVIEALALKAADEGLHVAVVLGRLGRDELSPAADGFQNICELAREERVAVVDEVGHVLEPAVPYVALVAGDLGHPLAVGVAADAAAPDLAGGDVLEEQDVLAPKAVLRQQLVGGEVAGGEDVLVRLVELADVALRASVGREDAVLVEDALDGHEADLVAQPVDEVGNPPVAPVGVVPADPHNGIHGLLVHRRASASGGMRPMGVLVRHKFSVPVHERPRRPHVLVPLQLVGVETVCGTGEPGAVSIGQFGTLLPRRLGELLLVDGQLRLEVVDERLLPLDHLPSRAVAHRPHERVQLAV